MAIRWFVTGATGRLGTLLRRMLEATGAEVVSTSLTGRNGAVALDLAQPDAVAAALTHIMPDHVLHLGGMTHPVEVDCRPEQAYRVNVTATHAIAEWCADHHRRLLFTSTDQVFSGTGAPFGEAHDPIPATLYGEMKREGERAVLAAGGVVARCGWLINDYAGAAPDMLATAMQRLRAGEPFFAVDNEWRTPIGTTEAAAALIRLATLPAAAIIHVAGMRHYRPIDLVRRHAARLGLPRTLIHPICRLTLGPPGRPADARLDSRLMHAMIGRQEAATVLAA